MNDGLSQIFNKQGAKASLGTKIVGRKIFAYDWVTSTNDIAHFLAKEGESEGTVIFARGQTQGRGRLGNVWVSPYNEGLYFSFILRPLMTPQEAQRITLTIGLAIAQALKDLSFQNVAIKWPNDIFLSGKKVAGILTEMSLEGNKTSYIVVGVGINVNTLISDLPPNSTSLRKVARRDFDMAELSHIILRAIDEHYVELLGNNFSALFEKIKGFSRFLLGSRVRIAWQDKTIEGYAQSFDELGALIVKREDGSLQKIFSGHLETIGE